MANGKADELSIQAGSASARATGVNTAVLVMLAITIMFMAYGFYTVQQHMMGHLDAQTGHFDQRLSDEYGLLTANKTLLEATARQREEEHREILRLIQEMRLMTVLADPKLATQFKDLMREQVKRKLRLEEP